jgi:hypothetical protein
MAQRKFKPHINIDQNPIEAVREIGGAVVESVKNDLARGLVTDLWDQMLGTEIGIGNATQQASGDLQEGQEITLKKQSKKEEKKAKIEAGWDYTGEIIHSERRIIQTENRELNAKVSEIVVELKKLAKSSNKLEISFKEITTEQRIESPGKYHLNFFEWMLSTVRSARMRIEDSANWSSLFSSKKAKREYWSLFKKHGTSFGLSGERIVATQTG